MSPARPAARAGFTLVELMIVITVILILASMILVIRPANPEGLANGQRMLASLVRSAKAQAMMNRAALPRPAGFTGNWTPTDFRYRVLIKNDPADPDRHLREVVIAVGALGLGPTPTKYTWFSPDPPVLLPPGVMFVPPSNTATSGFTSPNVTMPDAAAVNASGTSSATRLSRITGIADTWRLVTGTYENPGSATAAPMMRYRPLTSPQIGTSAVATYDLSTFHGTAAGGREWYYVELSADGTLGHTGRVLLVVAEGVNTGAGVRFEKPDRFAGILVRRNGEAALTVDTTDFEETALK